MIGRELITIKIKPGLLFLDEIRGADENCNETYS